MTIQVFRYGDTIRLSVAFVNFAGTATDPTSATLNVYSSIDGPGNLLLSKALADLTRESAGVYHYDYLVPSASNYVYEFTGTVDGTVSLGRAIFSAVWV